MRKFLIEVVAIMCTLLFAAVLIYFFTQNIGQNNYDTFTGNVSKVPLIITSPVYGQILTLPVKEGDTVTKGQTLATIEILNPDTIPAPSDLYHVHGNMLSIRSPSNGVVGQIALAPLSTIAGAGTLMQMYTVENTEIQMLIPQGYDVRSYTGFSASNTPDGRQYPLRVFGKIPANVVSNIPVTTTVYRANCQQVSDCQAAINNNAIIIYALKKQVQSPFLSTLRSWWNSLLQNI
ncbi:MAG: hypothetical protein NVSMB27_18830 [Ktedonobacteraceae bacterium]